MSIGVVLTLLSVWGFAADWEKPASEESGEGQSYFVQLPNVDCIKLEGAYERLIAERSNIACGSKLAVHLYNSLCEQWGLYLSMVGSSARFEPVRFQEKPAVCIAEGLPQQFKAALCLFHTVGQWKVMRVWDILCLGDFGVGDDLVSELKQALLSSLPQSEALNSCVLERESEESWRCTDALACAGAIVFDSLCPYMQTALAETDKKMFDFLNQCAGVYCARATEALRVFAPVFSLILEGCEPASSAVRRAYNMVQRLSGVLGLNQQGIFPIRATSDIRNLQPLLVSLRQENQKNNYAHLVFLGLFREVTMDSLLCEIADLAAQSGVGGKSCVSPDLEITPFKKDRWGFDAEKLYDAYDRLVQARDLFAGGSESLVDAYNKVCGQWCATLSVISEVKPFFPLVAENKELSIIDRGLSQQVRAALFLFQNRASLELLILRNTLLGSEEFLQSSAVEVLKSEMVAALPLNNDVKQCMQDSVDSGWVCSDALARSAQVAFDMRVFQREHFSAVGHEDLYHFFVYCVRAYYARAQKALSTFKPIFPIILGTDVMPFCTAVRHTYEAVHTLAPLLEETLSADWYQGAEPNTLQEMNDRLKVVQQSCLQNNNEDRDFLALFRGSSLRSMWTEVFRQTIRRDWDGMFKDFSEFVSLMEGLVPEQYMAAYCLSHAFAIAGKGLYDFSLNMCGWTECASEKSLLEQRYQFSYKLRFGSESAHLNIVDAWKAGKDVEAKNTLHKFVCGTDLDYVISEVGRCTKSHDSVYHFMEGRHQFLSAATRMRRSNTPSVGYDYVYAYVRYLLWKDETLRKEKALACETNWWECLHTLLRHGVSYLDKSGEETLNLVWRELGMKVVVDFEDVVRHVALFDATEGLTAVQQECLAAQKNASLHKLGIFCESIYYNSVWSEEFVLKNFSHDKAHEMIAAWMRLTGSLNRDLARTLANMTSLSHHVVGPTVAVLDQRPDGVFRQALLGVDASMLVVEMVRVGDDLLSAAKNYLRYLSTRFFADKLFEVLREAFNQLMLVQKGPESGCDSKTFEKVSESVWLVVTQVNPPSDRALLTYLRFLIMEGHPQMDCAKSEIEKVCEHFKLQRKRKVASHFCDQDTGLAPTFARQKELLQYAERLLARGWAIWQ